MHRLTGEWTLSLNNISVKWNYARPDGGWSAALLRQVGLDDLPGKWPERIMPLGKGEARLSAAAAAESGAAARNARGAGRHRRLPRNARHGRGRPGDLAMIMGSSTCHLANSAAPLLGSGMSGCYPDAVAEGTYTLEGGQTATGSILDWYRRHFAGNEAAEAAKAGRHVYEVLDAKAAAVAAGLRRPGLPRLLAGQPLSAEGPARPRRLLGPDAGARPRPPLPQHLRGDGLRHAPHPRRLASARLHAASAVRGRRRGKEPFVDADPRRRAGSAGARCRASRRRARWVPRWSPPSTPDVTPTWRKRQRRWCGSPKWWNRAAKRALPTKRVMRATGRRIPPCAI